eukprot:487979-Amphidinium_carterae.3
MLGGSLSYPPLVQLVLQTSTLVCVWQQRSGVPAAPVAPVCEVEQSTDLEVRVIISIVVQFASTLILVAVACCCNRADSSRVPRVVCKPSLAGANGSRRQSIREI